MASRSTISWNAYPGLLVAAAFSLGIAAAEWVRPDLGVWILLGGAALCTAIVGLAQCGRLFGLADVILTAAALLGAFSAGGVRQSTFGDVEANHIARLGVDREVHVVGRIASAPVATHASVRFVLQLDPVRSRAAGLVQVGIRRPREPLRTCDVVELIGRLTGLPHARNPGDFDYGRYLRRKRIFVRLYASGEHVHRLDRVTVGIACMAAGLRSGIARRIDRYILSREARGIVRALILGDRRAIDQEVRSRFIRTGLLHLLAVSGLHVLVVGMILYRLLRPSLMRLGLGWRVVEVVRSVLTGFVLLGYMILTGGSASVVRAVVMTMLFMAATPLQRTTHSLNTLGVAAVVILAMRPSQLFEPGFQLSTAAVWAIIIFPPLFSDVIAAPASRAGRAIYAGTTVTLAATIGTLPIVLAQFGQAALAGLVLNLPAVPLTTATLSSGIAAVAAGEIATSLGTTFGASTDVLARLVLLTSEIGDRFMSWSILRWNFDHPSGILALSLVVAALARWKIPHHRWPLLIASLAVATIHLWAQIYRSEWTPHVDILFLDVGQGDAALVLLPNARTLLIDAGPRTRTSDAADYAILPQLTRLGIEKIHTVVITHPDSDHLGGLPTLLRTVPVGRVVRSGFHHTSELYREANHLLDSLDIPQTTARAGDTLDIDPSARLYVFHPSPLTDAVEANANSLVLKLRFGRTSALLMGDAPVDAELEMLQTFGSMLTSDVLKVGHHGSRTSSSGALLSRVRQAGHPLGVISVASQNRFGLPDEDVIQRLRRFGYRTRSTAKTGAVWVRMDGRHVHVVNW